ncbi:hypothetical protein Tsubulata_044046 [Turnera subulata]|uniref:PB1 domain-containing protein n=1 Tax=Turnera subulata TaxID=218843 RepID=A0A9Q0J0F8_9ROSI|nr:hypothetical protein Tsubulata_044046 [Turnera subulata]
MENFSFSSYPGSGDSSPRSREIDDTQSWDDTPPSLPLPPSSSSHKVKLLCSYGGKIQPRPHDYQLAYVGGDTKILAVDRHIKFAAFMSKLASLSGAASDVCVKYQLPGEDLDALISVTNDEDLDHMMLEYDRLLRGSAKPARLRLFLFQLHPPPAAGSEVKSERQWFVDALNSVQILNLGDSGTEKNADFLFGLDKAPPPPAPAAEILTKDSSSESEEFRGMSGGMDKMGPPPTAVPMPMQMPIPTAYITERHVASAGGGYSDTPQQPPPPPVYLIPTAVPGMFQAPPPPQGMRPSQGYYGVARVVPEVYPEQPVYNVAPGVYQQQQQQQQQKIGGYGEGIGIVPTKVGAGEQGFLQVGYDGAGRQVYFTAAPYQSMAAAPLATVDGGRQGGGGGDGKVVSASAGTQATIA